MLVSKRSSQFGSTSVLTSPQGDRRHEWKACFRLLPQPGSCIPAETNRVVQVKYTNQNVAVHRHEQQRDSMLLVRNKGGGFLPASTAVQASLAFSGSNQARKGRL